MAHEMKNRPDVVGRYLGYMQGMQRIQQGRAQWEAAKQKAAYDSAMDMQQMQHQQRQQALYGRQVETGEGHLQLQQEEADRDEAMGNIQINVPEFYKPYLPEDHAGTMSLHDFTGFTGGLAKGGITDPNDPKVRVYEDAKHPQWDLFGKVSPLQQDAEGRNFHEMPKSWTNVAGEEEIKKSIGAEYATPSAAETRQAGVADTRNWVAKTLPAAVQSYMKMERGKDGAWDPANLTRDQFETARRGIFNAMTKAAADGGYDVYDAMKYVFDATNEYLREHEDDKTYSLDDVLGALGNLSGGK